MKNDYTHYALDSFRKAVHAEKEIENPFITKIVECETKAVGKADDRLIRFTVSSSSIDREGDAIAIKGWKLNRFNSKGVFLWAHNRLEDNPPIGQPIKAWKSKDELLKLDAQFLPHDYADHDWVKFADMLYKMYRDGILNDTSVGFHPIEYKAANREGFFPMDFLQQELLEVSAVPIGANPDVGVDFVKAKDAGIDIEPMITWTEKVLEGEYGPGIWLPREKAEQLYSAIATPKIITMNHKDNSKVAAGSACNCGCDEQKIELGDKEMKQLNTLIEQVGDISTRVKSLEEKAVKTPEDQTEENKDEIKAYILEQIKQQVHDEIVMPDTGKLD